jgi:hypothetical protein
LVALLLVLLLPAGMLGAPESPNWLAPRDRPAAEETARRLWGPSGASQLAPVGTSGAGKEGGWGDCFAAPYRKPVLIGCMLFVFQQFSGINALIYFSSSVFKQVSCGAPALSVGHVWLGGWAVCVTDQS